MNDFEEMGFYVQNSESQMKYFVSFNVKYLGVKLTPSKTFITSSHHCLVSFSAIEECPGS